MLILAVVLAASGPNPFLAEARVHYQALDYSRCLKRLDQAGIWKSTLEEEAEVALYRGLCRFGQGNEAQAQGDLELALKLSPTVALPPYSSPRLRELFAAARTRAGVEERPPDLPKQAELPKPEPPPPALAPQVAAVMPTPPHVPSVRSRSIAPWLVGGVGVLGTAVGIGLGVHAQQLEKNSFRTTFEADTRAAAMGSRAFADAANVSYALATAAAVTAGVLFLVDWAGTR